jgi:hypothetical protein
VLRALEFGIETGGSDRPDTRLVDEFEAWKGVEAKRNWVAAAPFATRKLLVPDQQCIKRRSDGNADVQDERPP